MTMQLKDKNAVIYGAGGAVGGAVARTFAREGARVFLTGRTPATLDLFATDIASAGGRAETAQVCAFDESAIERHAAAVVAQFGKIDISFNAITAVPQPGTQGIPISNLSVESFTAPITLYLRSQFLTARAAVRHMLEKKTGVILMHTPEPARLGAPLVGGMGPAWAAMEAFNRNLSAEFASRGIRAVCIRSTGLPETRTIDVVFGLHSKAIGISQDQFLVFVENMTHRKRSTTIAEVAGAAVFLASDQASGMTGTVLNLSGGMIVD
jgi:NAD(P)-dependent dehydrogenase (short-subunit alcohol dehydrogenase family)